MRTARRRWRDLPPALVTRVEDALGGAVEDFQSSDGGFSAGGVVGVALSRTGDRLFLMAVPAVHPAADDYRLEAAVSRILPVSLPSPALRFFVAAEGWVLLAFDVVDGRAAREPWTDEELTGCLAALTVAGQALTPMPAGVTVPTVSERMRGRCNTWRTLASAGVHGPLRLADLSAWEHTHLPRLAALESDWDANLRGTSLLHFDPRHDNFLISPGGEIALVDWGRACSGPTWIDLVCLLLESNLGPRDPETLFSQHPVSRSADAAEVDGFLVALATYWRHAAALPDPDGAPHLRHRQRYSATSTLGWLRQRWNHT